MGAIYQDCWLHADDRSEALEDARNTIYTYQENYPGGYSGTFAEVDGVEFRDLPEGDTPEAFVSGVAQKWEAAIVVRDPETGRYYMGAWCSS